MRTVRKRAGVNLAGLVVAGMVAFTLAACSSPDDSSGGASTGSSNAAAKADVNVAAMDPVSAYAGPKESFKPPAGKRIMILVCGNAGRGCIDEANAQKAAVESLGWKAQLVDGRFDPKVWNQAVQQAVDSNVDGIIAVAADPKLYGDAMESVAKKNIPFVLTAQSQQAGDPAGIDSYISPDAVTGGTSVAQWIAAVSDSKAKVLLLDLPGYADAVQRTRTINDKLSADCKGCKVYKANISVPTMGTSLAPLVTAQLQQHPDVDYVWSPDDAASGFVAQGIQQAGKTDSIRVVSTGGTPDQLARIKDGTGSADLANSPGFQGWLAVDTMARLIAGQPAQTSWASPQRLWTTDNIADASADVIASGWNLEFDYQSYFKTLWGIS